MIFGVGHDTCVFSGISFWSSLYVFSLGGRLLNPTKPLWAWTDKIIRQPHAQNQPQPKINLQIRQVKIQMITNGQDFASWKLQAKIYHWTWMHSCWKKQSMEWQMLTSTMSNQWNQAASFFKSKQNSNAKNLLKTTKLLGHLPVKVSPHRTLNSSKFVIQCEELDTMEEDEIKK